MRRWTPGIIAGISLSLLTLPASFACADDADVQTSANREPVTVSVPIRTINTPERTGLDGIITIRVGKAAPISVIADTGSVGLFLFEKPTSAHTAGIQNTAYLQGNKLPGVLFTAPVTIGGVTTANPVSIQYVNSNSSYVQKWKRRGIVGVLGLGDGNGGRMTNVLKSMPGSLGLRWSIHFDRPSTPSSARKGALVLGAEPPTDVTMHFQLPYMGVDVNGAKMWNDHAAPGCWSFTSVPEQCVPTWFDSGGTIMRLVGRNFRNVPRAADSPSERAAVSVDTVQAPGKQPPATYHLVKPGTHVKFAEANSAFYGNEFIAGRDGSRNLVRVMFAAGSPAVNTGNSLYFDFTFTYDQALGTISLSDKKGN